MVKAHYDGVNIIVDGEVIPKYVRTGENSERKKITSVTFTEGLQSIGNYAFDECHFTSVTFPEGLQSIGEGSFSKC